MDVKKMVSVIAEKISPILSVPKHFLDKLPPPPNFTNDPPLMLAVTAIHAALLAIVLGVLATYGLYRRTVSDQLQAKLLQEASTINDIRFALPEATPEQLIKEAKQLRESTSLTKIVEDLRVIMLKGEPIQPNLQDDAVAAEGKDAFRFMLALSLHSPFPDATQSLRDPTLVPFPNIGAVKSWVKTLKQVTRPLIRAEESASNNYNMRLFSVLRNYSKTLPPVPEMFSTSPRLEDFYEPFFQNLKAAHEIRHRVKGQLQEIDRHKKSGVRTEWLAVGFLGTSLTFVISVLIPLLNLPSPILRKVVFWEPMAFYILALIITGYLISKPVAFCILTLIIIGYLIFRQ